MMRFFRRHLLTPLAHALALAVGLAVATASTAAGDGDEPDTARVRFNISPGDAVTTLRKFAAQSRRQLVYPVDEVRGVRTRAVQGVFGAREALEQMLAGTSLRVVLDEATGAYAVKRVQIRSSTDARERPAAVEAKTEEERFIGPVRMSPFEIVENPADSYTATQSNTLASFRIPLERVPATSQVFTRAFMDDVAATSIEQVLIGYSGVATAASSNPGSQLDMPGDRNGAGGISVRGVAVSDLKRDGFIGPTTSARTAGGYTDNFSVERVELIEGPQSILFGSVGGGGVVNVVSKRARFAERSGEVKFTIDQRGSKRALIDFNQGTARLAFRLAAVSHEARTGRFRLSDDFDGVYAQTALRLGPQTVLRFNTERTRNDSRVSFRPNLNPFFAADDPRRGMSSRFLVLTRQLDDLEIVDGGLSFENIDSLASWWSSESITTTWSSLTLETVLPGNWSAQVVAAHVDTDDLRVFDGRSLVPARGLFGSADNPFDETAVRIGSPVKVNEQHDRNRGVRLTFLHEDDLHLGRVEGHSQTALGGHFVERGPSFGSSGIARAYYLADSQWNPVIDPARTVDYGRVPLGAVYFPVQHTIPRRPLFRPGQSRVVLDGQNYVLLPRIMSDPARATPTNPYGLVPNNPTPENPGGFVDNWNRGVETRGSSIYAANFTDWSGGRFTTLVGCSLSWFESANYGPGNAVITPRSSQLGWQAGLTAEIRPGLRAYAVAGTAEHTEASTSDLYGRPLKNPRASSPVPEFGLKWTGADDRFSVQIGISPETETLNEDRNTGDASFLNAVNPNGINGHLGGSAANQRVNLDRTLSSASLVVTANPTPGWRLRMLVSRLGGQISRTVSYRQLYNDEFHSAAGVVTYADGTPVLVDPTGGGGSPTTPLTLAMINDPAGAYYATPDATSGSITNESLRAVLMTPDPVHGSAATGRTGLPLSSMQYDFISPHADATVVVFRAGEKNTGFNEVSCNLQSQYTFSSGWLGGFGFHLDLQGYLNNRAYYATRPGVTDDAGRRQLVRLPDLVTANLGLSYRRKWRGKFELLSQLTIRNLFDHSEVWVVPSPANAAILDARLSAQPRQFIWSNSVRF